MTDRQETTITEEPIPDRGITHEVGNESVAIITRLSPVVEGQDYIGNILRRTCHAAGELSCQAACVRRGTPEYEANADRLCADRNLAQGLKKFGIDPGDVLMVGVTGDEVGFGGQLDEYRKREKNGLKDNPEGWKELAGFNAFFARAHEVPAIGSRLADCAHLEFEFKDKDGETVIGFEHGTRTNMFGWNSYKFEIDGRPVSYTEYVLTTALRYYEADPQTVRMRLSSSIQPQNFVKHFDSIEALEKHLPGWYDAGFLENATDLNWWIGEAVDPEDEWRADARGLILQDIDEAMAQLGIEPWQVYIRDMLDPADSNGEFSSHQNRNTYGDTRDLYLIAHKSAFKE